MTRPMVWTDYQFAFRSLATIAVAGHNARGAIQPAIVALGLSQPGLVSELIQLPTELASTYIDNDAGEARLQELIERILSRDPRMAAMLTMLRMPSLDMVAVINEAWVVSGSQDDYENVLAEVEKHGTVENHPRRQDALIIRLHTRDGQAVGICPIDSAGCARVGGLLPGMSEIQTPEMCEAQTHFSTATLH